MIYCVYEFLLLYMLDYVECLLEILMEMQVQDEHLWKIRFLGSVTSTRNISLSVYGERALPRYGS